MSDEAAASGEAHVADRRDTVDVFVQVPPDTADADVTVSGGADALQVQVKDAPQPLLSIMQLYSTVDPALTSWRIDDSQLVISLHKRDASLRWPGLNAMREEPESQQEAEVPEGAGAAMQERGRVRDLLQAAQDGDMDAFKTAARHYGGSDVGRVRDGNGRTVLHFAAQVAQLAMCSYLLDERQMDVNVQDDRGETALSLAAGAGLLDTVALLLSHGADPNLCSDGSAAPIHRAASSGNVEVVQALIAAGADLEASSDAGTALVWAAGSGTAPVVAALLDAGASPAATAEGNVSGVFMAAASGSEDVVELLLAAKADPNTAALGGATALHAAAAGGNLTIVLALLQAGADTAATDEFGARPIEAAAEAGAREVVETLLPLTSPPEGHAGEWSAVTLMDAYAPSTDAPAEASPTATQEVVVPQPRQEDAAAAAEHKMQGDVAFRAGLFEAAVRSYTNSLDASTADARVWANRSAAHLASHNAAAALEDARIAHTVDPTYAKAWYREGAAAQALERWEAAAQAFFEAFRLDPENTSFSDAFQNAVARGQAAHAAAAGRG